MNRFLARSSATLPWLAAVVICGLGHVSAQAEQPSWQSLRQNTYVIRYHSWNEPAATDTSGIWSYAPLSTSYRRLRPFYYNAWFWGLYDGPGSDGRGSYLATMGDRLAFEGWPSMIEIDLGSMRILRRYAELDPSLQAYGWAIQGPIIDSSLAENTGLSKGIYGFARCLYPVVASGDIFPVQRDCQSTLFPGAVDAIQSGTLASVMLRGRVLETGGEGLSAARVLNPERWASVATFDPDKVGFWLLGDTSVAFHPIVGGHVGGATTSIDLRGPPLNKPNLWLDSVFCHPTQNFFLLSWTDPDQPTFKHLSVLSDDLSQRLVDDVVGEPGLGAPPVAFAALAEDPPATDVQTIPIVAHTSGKNGTYWTSDLYLYNPSAEAMIVSVRRVTKPDVVRYLELPAHGSAAIPDVLTWAGGGPAGDGTKHDALVLTTDYRWGENLVAAARVWTPDSDPQLRAEGGTEGQAVPAVPDTVGYSNHLPWLGQWFGSGDESTAHIFDNQFPPIEPSQLVLDNRIPGRFRFNLGLLNDRDEPLTVKLTSVARRYLEDGGADTTRSIQLDPHTVKIVDIESLFPPTIADGYPPILGVSGDSAALWLSMVDNITGDATFVPFSLLNETGDDFTRFAIPAVAHLPGRNGTYWTTDLYGVFWRPTVGADSVQDLIPRMWFHPSEPSRDCGGAGAELMEEEVEGQLPMDDQIWLATLGSIGQPPTYIGEELWGNRHIFPDIVHLFAPCAGDNNVRGAFEMKQGSWMSGFTRTYTTRDDGGTYGGMLPLYPPHGWPVQHFAGLVVSSAFRINVGLYNGDAEHAITHRLTLYDADGVKVAENELTLDPWANLVEPLETVLNLPKGSLANGTYGLTVLPLDDEANGVEGRSWAFVSLVDNVTGDSTNWW